MPESESITPIDNIPAEWIASVYTAERQDQIANAQNALANLAIATLYVVTFVYGSTSSGSDLPTWAYLAAPLVVMGVFTNLVQWLVDMGVHAHLIRDIEEATGPHWQVKPGHGLARSELAGSYTYFGGGFRNVHVILINYLGAGAAFGVVAGFVVYCVNGAGLGQRTSIAIFASYTCWLILLFFGLYRSVTKRRANWLDSVSAIRPKE